MQTGRLRRPQNTQKHILHFRSPQATSLYEHIAPIVPFRLLGFPQQAAAAALVCLTPDAKQVEVKCNLIEADISSTFFYTVGEERENRTSRQEVARRTQA